VVYLRKHGFTVDDRETNDLTAVKRKLGVPPTLASCHTGTVDGYVVEGHVPADVIEKLLRDRPKVVGIAVPGMPVGSPGMEVPGQKAQPYTVELVDERRTTTPYERH